MHDSSNSVVLLVEDTRKKCKVALKMMVDKTQWMREKNMRQTGDDLLKSHVIEIFDSHIDESADAGSQFPYLISMPAAEIDLYDYLSHSRIAGRDMEAVVDIMRQVGEHLQALHSCGQIHGDLKPVCPHSMLCVCILYAY